MSSLNSQRQATFPTLESSPLPKGASSKTFKASRTRAVSALFYFPSLKNNKSTYLGTPDITREVAFKPGFPACRTLAPPTSPACAPAYGTHGQARA